MNRSGRIKSARADEQTRSILLHLVGFEEAFELANPGRVTHFAKRLGFDLANPLAGDFELAADFFESSTVTVDQAEALLEHLPLAFG